MLVSSLATIAPALADEEPIPLPPITVNPPFIICKISDGDTKPGDKKDEQPSAKCLGGGGPPLPGGGGSGGGGGGGGGGSPGIIPTQNNPNNQNPAASCDTPELAVPYAVAEVGPFLSQLDNGDRVLIQYLNGQTELFDVIFKTCSIPVAPVPGTCS